ncbi:hypothetical protein LJG11_28880, partial [Pseudomonas aeruginosa]|uniref:hypothetical protein n=1 Tax=Pseudomonas aeruginosa TaxID=287 RepID=UPI001D0A745F
EIWHPASPHPSTSSTPGLLRAPSKHLGPIRWKPRPNPSILLLESLVAPHTTTKEAITARSPS